MTGLTGLLMTTALLGLGQTPEPVFEKLGPPVMVRELFINAVTHGPDGVDVAWGLLNVKGRSHLALVGVRLDTGKTILHDLSQYGSSSSCVFGGADGNVYAYCGNPAHFFRMEAATGKLVDLGVPVAKSNYFNGEFIAGDGKAYIGTYPTTALAWVDTNTGEIGSLGRVSDDAKECYALSTAVADDGMIYAAAGLHHPELWALDPRTGQKRQLLPEKFATLQGTPQVWRAADGQVYAYANGVSFRCQPDAVEQMASPPKAVPNPRPRSGPWSGAILAETAP